MPDEGIIEGVRGTRKFSVLIVDDACDDRFLVKKAICTSAGAFTIVGEVANGHEAISYLSGGNEFSDRQQYPFPDVLLLDLRMPVVDGYAVLAWLRKQRFPGLRVLVLTGSLEVEERRRMMELGVEHAYIKPWRREALVSIFKDLESQLVRDAA